MATIKGEGAARAASWRRPLSGGKKIIVCTIQTFPFALKAVQELAATQGKRFAVIADEAHSLANREAAAKLKTVLSAEELRELEDGRKSAPKTCSRRRWRRARRTRALPMWPLPRRPRPRPSNCSGDAQPQFACQC